MTSFFFQAEDGIRDGRVTGVQTCALPIYIALKIDTALYNVEKNNPSLKGALPDNYYSRLNLDVSKLASLLDTINRSEERRVGKECSYCLLVNYYKEKL